MLTRNFKDLNLLFKRHPQTKDAVKVTGRDAIKQSVRNLVLTKFYQRPYRPNLGSKAAGLLFENMDSVTEELIRDTIKDVIDQYEPRASVLEVTVRSDVSENAYEINIYYKIENIQEPIEINFYLYRNR